MNANAPLIHETESRSRATDAMDRVLAFERDAQARVSECERACANVLEQSRRQAQAILERMQRRIVALHARAAKRVELQAAELVAGRMKSAAVAAERLSDPARRIAAVEQLAARLTTAEAARRDGD